MVCERLHILIVFPWDTVRVDMLVSETQDKNKDDALTPLRNLIAQASLT